MKQIFTSGKNAVLKNGGVWGAGTGDVDGATNIPNNF